MSKKKKRTIIIIVTILILLVSIFLKLSWELNKYIILTNRSDNTLILRDIERGFDSTMSDMECKSLWDEASIEEYNKLFDGKEHYLHDIDINTNFGNTLFENTPIWGRSFDEIEEGVHIENQDKNNKDIVIKYVDDILVFRIPHSNIEYSFWKDKKELEYITHITYVEPHNRE